MDRIMSSTPEISYRQIKTFFGEKELFADNRCRPLLKFLPPPMRVAQYTNGYLSRSDGEEGTGDHGVSHSSSSKSSKKRKKRKQKALQNQTSHTEESVLDAMLSWPRPITSVLIIKPDAFPRHVVKILRRLYQEKFSVVAIRMAILSEDQASQVMPTKYEKMLGERSVFTSHMTSSASLVVCVQRINAVRRLVDVAGPIDPREAHKVTTCGNGNWRAEFGIDEFSNAIHVSEKYVAACEEQKLFFPEGLCCKQTLELKMEQIPFVQDYSVMREDKVKGREVGVCDNPNVDLLGTTGMEIQPVCLVLSSPVINCPKSDKKPGLLKMYPPYIDIMEQLLTQGYEICAWHMTCFSVNQAKKLYELMGDKSSNNLQFTVNLLTSGPSFLLYMQRENGLILFDSILGSCLRRYSLLEHAPNILRTQTLKQTHICVKHLFHRLENKRSIIRISHKRALEWQDRNGVTNS
uniref:Uncharacterized protein LOC104266172 n=1 Tax=Phallusia mammillata TaxID=59560 RepID=A0A6F9DJQ8_9ASCI|nr:uncharacterized protein LOC104266172 [Phallusia mammillata]